MSMKNAEFVTGPEPAPYDPKESETDVFEGPEKKLEVFFGRPTSDPNRTFRSFNADDWTEVLAEAKCSILHVQAYEAFDAYLLSESSLFVYPTRVILKTCGTTTLILVLPKLLALAAAIGAPLDHVHYSHYRYKFPELQLYPHTSFATEEQALAKLLAGHIAKVHTTVLGDPSSGHCWYALCTEPPAPEPAEPPLKARRLPSTPALLKRQSSGLPADVDDLFEVAMEGLPADVCATFVEGDARHGGKTGRALARSMTAVSGIGSLMPGEVAVVDDWAFSPCGYSMNAGSDRYYYTIHITPELGFSYASFETNDPAFRRPEKLRAVLGVFRPRTATVTLTTRGAHTDEILPDADMPGLLRTNHTHRMLSPAVAVDVLCFGADPLAGQDAGGVVATAAAAQSKGVEAKSKADADGSDSEAASEDTCTVGEAVEL